MSEKMMNRRQALFATAGAAAAAATATVASTGTAHAEFQPAMQAALQSLQTARTQLQWATADKGGHRLFAIGFIDQAINQVNLGIQWDNVH